MNINEDIILAIGIALPCVSLIIVIPSLCFLLRRRRKREDKLNPGSIMENVDRTMLIKNEHLKDKLVVLANDTSKMKKEFKDIENMKLETKETTLESVKEANLAHNRYGDIAPYDGNRMTTHTQAGDPPTNYINASPITFEHMKQTFIATQAPKPNSFQNFWQLVVENKVIVCVSSLLFMVQVCVIVMITSLTEGNKKKADRYWPDKENIIMDLENGLRVEHKGTSSQGTYIHRRLEIQPTSGASHEVSQLQITKWMDLTAPDDTKILLDLINKTKELVGSKRDIPVVVHCSAGVGRTGTYIGVFKLMQDYYNDKIKMLDPFLTVVQMRRQRMKMVQKPAQYVYMVRCVKDLVRTEEVAYYDN